MGGKAFRVSLHMYVGAHSEGKASWLVLSGRWIWRVIHWPTWKENVQGAYATSYSAICATLCISRSGCRPSHKSTHLWLLLRS